MSPGWRCEIAVRSVIGVVIKPMPPFVTGGDHWGDWGLAIVTHQRVAGLASRGGVGAGGNFTQCFEGIVSQ
jgi:hypothetical protein